MEPVAPRSNAWLFAPVLTGFFILAFISLIRFLSSHPADERHTGGSEHLVEAPHQAEAEVQAASPEAKPGAKAPPPEITPPPRREPDLPHPDHLRGIYLTGYTAGGPRFHELVAFAKANGLNAMVIDVKDDDGRISYRSRVPLAQEIGADSSKIKDPESLIRTLKMNGIYPIARIVVFCDPLLSQARRDLAITVNNSLWRDRRGLSWTSPYSRAVWEYNVEIAKEAASLGFQEIQFDYVRFPEKYLPGWTEGVPQERRAEAITGFMRFAREQLKPFGVNISADVFGLTTTTTDDMRIGQDYTAIALTVDYISPMVYPSHFYPGNFGLDNPNTKPYETVLNAITKAREKTPGLPPTRHRPWIQDFSLYGTRYGKTEVEAQIRGLRDAGIRSFLLWNPANVYTAGVNYRLIATTPSEEPAQPLAPAQPLPPNEMGRIMILEYHMIGPAEGRWARTPAGLRQDLEELYRRNYRPVNLLDVLDRRIDLPRGYSPVVLTFDDGTEGQFRYIKRGGEQIIDPDSAVGILLDFHQKHPDWGLKGTFYVLDPPFGEEGSWREKIRFLVAKGFEVGNHTRTHSNLAQLDAAATAMELAGQVRRLREADPNLSPATLALPYGAIPRAEEAARAGTHEGTSYHNRAFLLVGAGPAPSPYDPSFNPYRLPRIQAVDSRFEAKNNLEWWLRYFDQHPGERYVSDGDPAAVAKPPGAPDG